MHSPQTPRTFNGAAGAVKNRKHGNRENRVGPRIAIPTGSGNRNPGTIRQKQPERVGTLCHRLCRKTTGIQTFAPVPHGVRQPQERDRARDGGSINRFPLPGPKAHPQVSLASALSISTRRLSAAGNARPARSAGRTHLISVAAWGTGTWPGGSMAHSKTWRVTLNRV